MESTFAQKKEPKNTAFESGANPQQASEHVLGASAGMPLFLQRSLSTVPPISTPSSGPAIGQPGDLQEQQADQIASSLTSTDTAAITSLNLTAPADRQPLPSPVQTFFEKRLQTKLGDVQIHTGTEAIAKNQTLGSSALTYGNNIYFNADRYQPTTQSGLRLLAHELTHITQQQRGLAPLLQADFPDDFDSLQEMPASSGAVRPAGTIRATNRDGVEVFAPQRIYTLAGIPDRPEYNNLSMSSTIAHFIRNPGKKALPTVDQNQVTLGQLRAYEAAGDVSNMRVMIAHYDGQFHLVGFDYYQLIGSTPMMDEGYVEAQPGTRGVGLLLFAERIRRVFLRDVGTMRLEIGSSHITDPARIAATREFHQRLWQAAEKEGSPPETPDTPGGRPAYLLNTREMIRVLVRWGELPENQRIALTLLASGTAEPTVNAVTTILLIPPSGGPTSGGSGSAPPGGLNSPPGGSAPPEGLISGINQTLRQLQTNTRSPAVVPSLASLRDPAVVRQIQASNHGLASVNGVLYEVSYNQDTITTRVVEPVPVALGLPAAPSNPPGSSAPLAPRSPAGSSAPTPGQTIDLTGLPPSSGLVSPPILNLRPGGSGNITVGSRSIPPSVTTAGVGDLIVIGGTAEWLVADARTGQPIAGVFTGGQLYRLTPPNASSSMVFNTSTGRLEPQQITINGQVMGLTPVVEPAGVTPPSPSNMPRPAATAGAALGILAVAQQTLAPYAAAIGQQRQNRARAEGEIDFWTQLGAEPIWRIWDWNDRQSLPAETAPSVGAGIITNNREPYVVDINAAALQRRLSAQVGNYQQLIVLLDIGQRLGALVEREGRFYALVNKPDRDNHRNYDVTDTIEQIRHQMLQQTDEQMRTELGRLSTESLGNIHRLKSGSNTRLFRAAHGQRILSASRFLGSNPWVRTLGQSVDGGAWSWFRRGHYAARVLVTPANGDTLQAAVNSVYRIYQSIEDTLEEVRNGGRSIISESRQDNEPDGRLLGFIAGPDTNEPPRFGVTRYERNPEDPYKQTVAIGELKQFYVDGDELEPVNANDVSTYRAGQP